MRQRAASRTRQLPEESTEKVRSGIEQVAATTSEVNTSSNRIVEAAGRQEGAIERLLKEIGEHHSGAVDLFISYRDEVDGESHWTVPVPLPQHINSAFSDFAPGIGADGHTLYFTSERPGLVGAGEVEGRPPGDLYFVDLTGTGVLERGE